MSVSCMLHTFLKYRYHYTSNILVAVPVQCCNYILITYLHNHYADVVTLLQSQLSQAIPNTHAHAHAHTYIHIPTHHTHSSPPTQDDLLAELEELEQEELEGQLLDVETPSVPLEDPSVSVKLPDVRKCLLITNVHVQYVHVYIYITVYYVHVHVYTHICTCIHVRSCVCYIYSVPCHDFPCTCSNHLCDHVMLTLYMIMYISIDMTLT